MSSERRKQIRSEKARARTNRIMGETSGLRAALALSEGLLSVNTDRLVELEAMNVEHDKCPVRISALHRDNLSKDEEIAALKIQLALAKDNEGHWRGQAAAKQVELGDLQQEIGPLRNDTKGREIVRLRAKLHSVQIELSDALDAQ